MRAIKERTSEAGALGEINDEEGLSSDKMVYGWVKPF